MNREVGHILNGYASSSRLHTLYDSVIDAICLSQVVIGLLPTTQHLTGYSNSDLSIPKEVTNAHLSLSLGVEVRRMEAINLPIALKEIGLDS